MSKSVVPAIATSQGQKDFLADTRAVASEVLNRIRQQFSEEVCRLAQEELRGNHAFHQFCGVCAKLSSTDEELESKQVGPFPSVLWLEMTCLVSHLHSAIAHMDWSWLKSSLHDTMVEISQDLQVKEDELIKRWLLDAGIDDYDSVKRPSSGRASAKAPLLDQLVMLLVNTSWLVGSIIDSVRGIAELHDYRRLWEILMTSSKSDEQAAIKAMLMGTTINSHKLSERGFFHNPHGHAVLKRMARDKTEWYVREALIVLLLSATDRGHLSCRCRAVLTFVDAWVGVIVPDIPPQLQERLDKGLRDAIESEEGEPTEDTSEEEDDDDQ